MNESTSTPEGPTLPRTVGDLVLLAVRLTWGIQLAAIGVFKLIDLDGTAGFFTSLELPYPQASAVLVGLTESLCGTALAAGALARLAALPVAVTMAVAYATAHSGEPPLQAKPTLFFCAALVILVAGPGRYSLDAWRRGTPAGGAEPASGDPVEA
jgi:putative oxidoreductase